MTVPNPNLSDDERDLVRNSVNAIRALSMDAVERATCGHPGLPMGAADLAYVLWTRFLNHDPAAANWPDRDRFVLSAGHGSMLLYSLLHLTGYDDMTMEQIKDFRQWGSITAGHPEYGHASGIETTTGPLGQGISNAVGMALGEAMLAARVNTDSAKLVDHYTYVICSDGDLMEGVSAEACSLAGHLKLGKMIALYDDNGITIDGSTELAFDKEDVGKRFEAYGWHVQKCDGHDHAAIETAIEAAQGDPRPSIICAKTVIGYGAPNKAGTSGVHGSKLGEEELAATRKELGWEHAPFEVPEEIYEHWRASTRRGKEARAQWEADMAANPSQGAKLKSYLAEGVPKNLADEMPTLEAGTKIATRKASEKAINAFAPHVPSFVGGSADLTGSTNTFIKEGGVVEAGNYIGRNFHWGIREHGMAAACNGLALHGGFIPMGATFLTFSDYCRPSIRLSALMGIRSIQVMTHDSVFLGEDGPTHQAVEHVAALRLIPNLNVLRPDPNEVPYAWVAALKYNGPSIMVLTRQGMPVLDNAEAAKAGVPRGAYVVREGKGGADALDLILMATGSELHLATGAAEALEADGKSVRVVSMVSEFLFDNQDDDYKAAVLPTGPKRMAIEAGVTAGWWKWVGIDGAVHGIDHFGASAPAEVLAEKYGFTASAVAAKAAELLG